MQAWWGVPARRSRESPKNREGGPRRARRLLGSEGATERQKLSRLEDDKNQHQHQTTTRGWEGGQTQFSYYSSSAEKVGRRE